jgi:hypothetical protein
MFHFVGKAPLAGTRTQLSGNPISQNLTLRFLPYRMLESRRNGMKIFTAPRQLMLYSNVSPEMCARRLAKAVDIVSWPFFSFSGYPGTKPFLGEAMGRRFRVFKRIYSKSISIVLSGASLPRGRGTRVEGAFDLGSTTKMAMRLFGLFGVFVVSPSIVDSLRNRAVPLLFDVAFACIAVIETAIGPALARVFLLDQEREITDFLCNELEAGEDASAFESERES